MTSIEGEPWFFPWPSAEALSKIPEIERYSKRHKPDLHLKVGAVTWNAHRDILRGNSHVLDDALGLGATATQLAPRLKRVKTEDAEDGNGDERETNLTEDSAQCQSTGKSNLTLKGSARGWAYVLIALYRPKDYAWRWPEVLHANVEPAARFACICEGIALADKYHFEGVRQDLAAEIIDTLLTSPEMPCNIQLSDIWLLVTTTLRHRRNFSLLHVALDRETAACAEIWASNSRNSMPAFPRDAFAFDILSNTRRLKLGLSSKDMTSIAALQKRLQEKWFLEIDAAMSSRRP